MAIKDPLMFITIEEFKNWKGFNKLEFDDTTTPDNEIWFAISVASNNIDYLSGHSISKKWPETTLTEFTDEIQTATAYYVRFLLTKDSNYIRGQSSISQGGMTYSENNPNEPYYIVPEVFNCLRKIKEYPNITGFNLDVLPKRNDFFSNFYSNYGEDSPFTRYVEITNLKSSDPRVEIKKIHQKNIIGTIVDIDTSGIKSFDNLTTLELFTKYFSNDTMKLVDGKEGQEKKVISATGGKIDLSDYYKKSVFVKGYFTYKDDRDQLWINDSSSSSLAISLLHNNTYERLETNKKNIVGAINENKTNIDKKQDKENWKIIGKSLDNRTWEDFALSFNKYYRVFITWDKPPFNQTSVKLKIEFKSSAYIGGDYMLVKGKIDNEDASLIIKLGTVDGNKSQLIIIGGNNQYGNIFSLEELQDTIKVDIQSKLQIRSGSLTTNEVEENIWDIELKNNPTPSPSKDNWKEVGTREKNKWDNWQITYDFIVNKRYRVYYSWNIYNPVFAIQEFIITDTKIAGVPIEVFNNNTNVLVLSVNHAKFITIYSLKGNDKGNTWKLEELQE
ncbi:hypothetical protein [Spiroplasma endosymbiont of Acasis viretata]|uniref:hypothetical protein n=1 Tax=Spiroplasma endosymbiont of Acasis viretata TaxID=3066306 RepID=UPI00313EFF41